MKAILISPFTSVSGSAIRFWNIAQHLQQQGFEVVYVERRPKGAPKPSFENVRYLGTPKLKNLFADILVSLIYNTFVVLRHSNAAFYYALKPAPNNALPALLARKLGMKILVDIDDLDYGYFPKGFKRRISRYFFDRLPRHFDLVTCHTDKLRAHLTRSMSIPRDTIYFLAQGLSDVFANYSPENKPTDTQKSIVYCATLGITSDLSDLFPMFVRLIRDHPDMSISIIGDGVRRESLENKIDALGVAKNVHFLGRVPHEEIPEVMARHWIGINYMRPSTTNECRAVLKIREYLSVGLEVVCNDVGDGHVFSEYIELALTIDGMEGKIRRLLDHPHEVRWEGREFLQKNYRWSCIVEQFLQELHTRKLLPQNQPRNTSGPQ